MFAPAISDVSFDLPFRNRIAIVAPSGAGKSTIVNLLCRFFDPQEGVVLLGQHALTERDVLDHVFQLTTDRTLVVITHRPEKLFAMDAVFTFRGGRLEAL